MLKDRYLAAPIAEDLVRKMVFLAGPRQIGKTTLARTLIGARFKETAYFNWDNKQQRRQLMAAQWPGDAELIILDELHKYKSWKRFVKGQYDALKEKYKFLVTGSARLDIFRKGGDSLQGRYHHYRLHPFSLAETLGFEARLEPFQEIPIAPAPPGDELGVLERFGGFPEPLLSQNERTLRRWHNDRNERLFREDIRDVEMIRDLGRMKLLGDMLPGKVGALLSVNAVREDLEVSHRAASRWLDILESFYYHFRIYPYARGAVRSLKKEPKLYLWDWSEVEAEPARFENLVASHLLKLVHWLQDREGHKARLCFLRDAAKREVDFLVVVDEKPWFAVEVKTQDEQVSPGLRYFRERMKIPFSYQVLKKAGVDRLVDGVRVISANKFLVALR
ncbi:MAG: ATP-binding protein [Elusimicrobiota bacterium]|nr:ATP-binding protein [Elusimicrobiota bacterium]